MGAPPSIAPSSHSSPIWEASVISGKFYKLTGASGIVNIIAPLPGYDISLVPIILVAYNLAQIEAPHS